MQDASHVCNAPWWIFRSESCWKQTKRYFRGIMLCLLCLPSVSFYAPLTSWYAFLMRKRRLIVIQHRDQNFLLTCLKHSSWYDNEVMLWRFCLSPSHPHMFWKISLPYIHFPSPCKTRTATPPHFDTHLSFWYHFISKIKNDICLRWLFIPKTCIIK